MKSQTTGCIRAANRFSIVICCVRINVIIASNPQPNISGVIAINAAKQMAEAIMTAKRVFCSINNLNRRIPVFLNSFGVSVSTFFSSTCLMLMFFPLHSLRLGKFLVNMTGTKQFFVGAFTNNLSFLQNDNLIGIFDRR